MKKFQICLVFALFAFSSFVLAEDWPNWLGPERNGVSEESLTDVAEIGASLWEGELGIGFSSFAVAEGSLYSMGHRDGKETVWKLSARTGEVEGRFTYPAELMPNLHEGGPGSTPTVSDGCVYTMSKDGLFHVLSDDLSQVVWKKDMMEVSDLKNVPEWGFAASPVILDDLVLVEAGATFAFDRGSGEERWRSETYRPGYGSPQVFSVGGETFVAVLKTDGLVVLDAENGKTLGFAMWRTSFQTNSTTPLEIEEGRLFISTGYDQGCSLFSFNGQTLTSLYENRNMCNHMGNSVLRDGFLYGFDGTAHRGRPVEFTCLDPESGEKRWHLEGLGYGSVLGAGKDLVVLTEAGELLIGAASPDGFEERSRAQILEGRCWTPPVLANGVLYARNAAGRIVAHRLVIPFRW